MQLQTAYGHVYGERGGEKFPASKRHRTTERQLRYKAESCRVTIPAIIKGHIEVNDLRIIAQRHGYPNDSLSISSVDRSINELIRMQSYAKGMNRGTWRNAPPSINRHATRRVEHVDV